MIDINHLQKNNMTYVEHMSRALWLSFFFFMGSLFTLFHALCPFLLTTVSTDFNLYIFKLLNKDNSEDDENENENQNQNENNVNKID